MATRDSGAIGRNLHVLFDGGTLGELTDRQLLERFTSGRDGGAEAAFRALVARHGAMVLGVCRRILRDSNDADDAFQATFLILVRKAGSVRVTDSLGRWLYGVSYRVAIRARSIAARRGARESAAGETLPAPPDPEADREEIRAALDEELVRMPQRYRVPIVLCDLDGLTHEQAAQQLGCPVGTIKSRLARGRERLRDRLVRRGWTPAAGFTALAISTPGSEAAVPHPLMETTVREAVHCLIGKASAAAMVSASVVSLTEGVLKTMLVSKLLWGVGAIAAIGGAVVGSYVPAVLGSGVATQTTQVGASSGSKEPAQTKAALSLNVEEATISREVRDTVDRLKIELQKKESELRRADAQLQLSLSVLATNKRLNQRLEGRVSPEEMKKAEAEVAIPKAETDIIRAEIQLIKLKLEQANHGRIGALSIPDEANRLDTTYNLIVERRLQSLESKIDHVLEILKTRKP